MISKDKLNQDEMKPHKTSRRVFSQGKMQGFKISFPKLVFLYRSRWNTNCKQNEASWVLERPKK